MSAAMRRLLARCLLEVRKLTAVLDDGGMAVDAWRDAFAAALARYHTAAQLVGQGGGALDARGRAALTRTVQAQLGFLDKWALEIQDQAAYTLGRQARAALYAQGIGASYWRGATKMLPLPAMPRDGTSQCLSNCGCAWEIAELDGDGNYDCTWQLGKTENCQTCRQRAADWSPLQIRDGRLT